MLKSLFKLKDYDVHAITTIHGSATNANMATWLMQTDMGKKYLTVALYKPDYTLELAKKSGILNIHWLGQDFAKHLNLLGRKSGREIDKLSKMSHEPDYRGCPILRDAIGCLHVNIVGWADAGDHELGICQVEKQTFLHPDKPVLTLNYLREKKLVRG